MKPRITQQRFDLLPTLYPAIDSPSGWTTNAAESNGAPLHPAHRWVGTDVLSVPDPDGITCRWMSCVEGHASRQCSRQESDYLDALSEYVDASQATKQTGWGYVLDTMIGLLPKRTVTA